MVGAVLVYEDKIIGEGYHQKFGGPHAEVNCINSVAENEKDKVSGSALYVSLEPCSHFGKTPPCCDLIVANKIPVVVIGCRDPFKEVDGRGIEKLKAAGVNVIYGILENESLDLNKRFFTFHTKHKPYIILKWAETAGGKIAGVGEDRLLISNDKTNRLVHKWRSEEAAILVGTNTALLDDPELTTRNWNGPSPVRSIVDMKLKLPLSLKVFNDKQRTIIFNTIKHEEGSNFIYYQVTEDVNFVHQMVNAFYQMKIQSLLVEGGARLLQSFIDEDMWDEVRIIKNVEHPDHFGKELIINNGLAAPELATGILVEESVIIDDSIKIYKNGLG
jgi:diaminohydroxyphosphoribosylaminopyrimidine deaminase/5-amino-6-(5-phosphoribosylamino)uracil reductase